MDNYLSLLGRGLAKRKKFISLGRLDMARKPRHPSTAFSLERGGLKPELSNYLIV